MKKLKSILVPLLILSVILTCISIPVFAATGHAIDISETDLGGGKYKLTFAAKSSIGFNGLVVAFSYDNTVIVPVDNTTFVDVVITSGIKTPFKVFSPLDYFTSAVWNVSGARTGVKYSTLAYPVGVTSSIFVDVFEFYYRLADGKTTDDINSNTFILEDGRVPGNMVAALSDSRGITFNDGDETYYWGPTPTGPSGPFIPDNQITITYTNSGQEPAITTEPQSDTVPVGATGATHTLSVEATSPDGGTLTYQWYENTSASNTSGTAISGETGATYAAPIDTIGTNYYYVVITNTTTANGTRTAAKPSSVATLNVIDKVVNAPEPDITTQPQSATVTVGSAGATNNLNVVASSPDGGTLSYQWYSNESATNTGGTAISGATSATYAAPIDTAGTNYYYVVVTNTIIDNGDGGAKTATTTSSAATLTVNKTTYTGTTTVSDYVIAGQTTTGKTLTLPQLPDGASYPVDGTIGGTTALISSQSIAGTTLTYSTTSQIVGTSATITIPVNNATNYIPYNVVVSITATELSATLSGDITGYTGVALTGTQQVTVALVGDTFAATLSGGWITNLPAGLSQSVVRTNDTTAVITVTGTPTAASTAQIEVTIPTVALVTNTGFNATSTSGAVYNIVESTYTLAWDGTPGSFTDLDYGYSTGRTVTYTIKNTGNQTVTGISEAITNGSDFFEVITQPASSLAVGATTTVVVRSKTGLNASSTPYSGVLTVTWTGGNGATGITQNLSQTINKVAYPGTTTASDNVIAEQTTTNKTLTLPALSAGASYAATGTAGGTITALITGSPNVSGGVLTYSTSSQPNGTTATITIQINGGTNYNDSALVVTITAQPLQLQTIAFPGNNAVVNKTYGDDVFTNAATGGAGSGAITYASNNPSVATVDGSTGAVKIVSQGTATITATKAADATYAQATASYTLNVARKSLTVTEATATKQYDGNTNVTVTGWTFSGYATDDTSNDISVATYTAVYTGANAGTTTINVSAMTLSGAKSDNYTVTLPANNINVTGGITKKDISINTVAALTKDYDGGATATAGAVTFTGEVGGQELGLADYTVSAAFTDGNYNAGSNKPYTYTVTMLDTVKANNYNLAVKTKSDTNGVINKANYPGTTIASDNVIAEQITTDKTLTLPVPSTGASYAATGTAGGTTPGLITGTPSVSGVGLTYSTSSQPNGTTATITITVNGGTNYNDSALVVTVTVKELPEDVQITTTGPLPNSLIGVPYSTTLTAIGTDPITWRIIDGYLPDGLTLSSGGTISGIPTTEGTFNFTVRAENETSNDYKEYTIEIVGNLYIALGDSVTTGYGLTDPDNDSFVSILSGLFDAHGILNITENKGVNGVTSGDLLLALQNLSPTDLLALQKANIITLTIGGNNILGPMIDLFNQMSAGLDLTNPLDLLQLLTAVQQLDFTQLPQFADGVQAFADDFPQIIAWLKTNVPDAKLTVNTIYNPFPQSLSNVYDATELLIGMMNAVILQAQMNGDVSNYAIADIYSAFATAIDPVTNFDLMAGSIDIHPNVAGHELIAQVNLSAYFAAIPSIITNSLPDGTNGAPYSETIAADNSSVVYRLIYGELPDGLSLTADGTISGIPTVNGTFSFIVSVWNAAGSSTKTFTITIGDQPPNTYIITATAGPGGMVTGGGTYTANASVTLTATPSKDYTFDGWYESGTKINGAGATYTFTATANRTLEARFTYVGTTENNGLVGDWYIPQIIITPGMNYSQAAISETDVVFDKSNGKDIVITLNGGNYGLNIVKNKSATLVKGVDYIVEGNVITIKASYLQKLKLGDHTLTFVMYGGVDPKLNITITETKP